MLRAFKSFSLLFLGLGLLVSPVLATPMSSSQTSDRMDRIADPAGTMQAGSGIPLRTFVGSELDEMIGDTILVSTTWRDQLGTSSNTRFLAYTEDDPSYPNGVVKIVWQEHATASADRYTKYVEVYESEGELVLSSTGSVGLAQDGYPVLDVDQNGQQWPAFHSPQRLNDGQWDSAVMRESTIVPGFYDYMWVDRYDVAQAVWPGLAMQEPEGHLYAHTVGMSSGDDNPYDKSIFYNRMEILAETYSNATPGEEAQLRVTPYCEDIEAVVAANDESGVVAIAVPVSRHLRIGEDNGYYTDHRIAQNCNDVFLWISDDNGDTWDFENGGINVTDFIPPDETLVPDTLAMNKDSLRVYADVNAVVDNGGVVHVTFTTTFVDFFRSRGETSFSNRLWYWNSRDQLCIQMQGKIWNGVVPGAWQTFTNQCQLAVDENNGWVWAAWSQYGEEGDTINFVEDGEEVFVPLDYAQSVNDNSQNFALADIYVAVSPDGHRWTKPVNVTNTRDMTFETAYDGGLAPGDCRSEIHPSLAENVSGDYIHLFYLQDRDGGRAHTWNEGVTTEGELIYQRIAKTNLIAMFNEQAEWIHNYPIHIDSTDFWQDPDEWVWEDLVPDAVDEHSVLTPDQFELQQNYPNPFNPSTQIAFNLKKDGKVKLAVYDVLGREVATLVNRAMSAGSHRVTFLGADLPSGVYFYKLSSGSATQVRKMVLMK